MMQKPAWNKSRKNLSATEPHRKVSWSIILHFDALLRHPIKFRDIGRDIFQLEVSVKAKVPGDYILMSQTKTVKRYYTSALKELIKEHLLGTERLETIMQHSFENIQLHFGTFRETWTRLTTIVSLLDCLLSLAAYCNNVPGEADVQFFRTQVFPHHPRPVLQVLLCFPRGRAVPSEHRESHIHPQ
jgi:MutS-like protein